VGGGGRSPISRQKGGVTLFLSWEKDNFEGSSVKRSILTNFVATKSSKTPKSHLNYLFRPVSRDLKQIYKISGFFLPILGLFIHLIRL
jgi:hypothetical protein